MFMVAFIKVGLAGVVFGAVNTTMMVQFDPALKVEPQVPPAAW